MAWINKGKILSNPLQECITKKIYNTHVLEWANFFIF